MQMSLRPLVVRSVAAALLLSLAAPSRGLAQGLPNLNPPEGDITYILPWWDKFQTATDQQFATEVAEIRQRIGEGRYVRLGFSVDVRLSMTRWDVNPNDRATVRLALAGTIAEIDAAIARARTAGIPIRLGIFTAVRSATDPAQTASQAEDRRNMQWYSDNLLSTGWWTHSRYARKQGQLQEAYVREIGRVMANRIARYPETVVALAGDGEVELSYDRAPAGVEPVLADYSPFTIAEFRDWLRHDGLYAAGQPFAGEGYQLGTRYGGDASPADDTNGDGHTLNGDFGTTFTTWSLRYFDWSLTDSIDVDPNAIPATAYLDPIWNPLPAGPAGGFDAPRYRTPSDAWLQVWRSFRETMIWRHNLRYAKWITTSADDETGATVPGSRWYSYQIPGDYLFGHTPSNPHQRLETSASPLWTADVSPYGSMGVTSFNLVYPDGNGGSIPVRTLPGLAPKIAERKVRWGLLEWHACLPGDPSKTIPDPIDVCRGDMDLIVQYRPSLLVPFAWQLSWSPIEGTAFEVAMKELVTRLNAGYAADARVAIDAPGDGAALNGPFTVSGWAIDLGNRGPGRGTGIDKIHVYAYSEASNQQPIFLGEAQYGLARPDVGAFLGSQFASSGFRLDAGALPYGRYRLVVYARTIVTESFSAAQSVGIAFPAPTSNPAMSLDGPSNNSTVGRNVTIAGWAIDRGAPSGTGVDAIDVWAYPSAGAPQYVGRATYGQIRPDVGGVFGSQFTNSGYRLTVTLSPGQYRILAFARSMLAGTFNAAVGASVTVQASATNAVLFIDQPGTGTHARPFTISGWAIDTGADAGSGVDAIHVWAFPTNGGAASFVGVAAYGSPRADIASVFGDARFRDSGFSLTVDGSNLAAGTYDVIVFGRSTVTGGFTVARVVRVTVQ